MPNRIDQTPAILTIPRQTPKNDFGEVLSRTVSGAVRMGGSLIQGTVGGMPIVSAAVSAVQNLAGNVKSASYASQSALPVASVPGTNRGASTQGGVGPDKYSDTSVQQMYEASQEAFQLQLQMQQESREYNAISNVIKVRHDSAKAAINNIR